MSLLTPFGGMLAKPFLDDDGHIVPGGLVNFYETGTLDRKDTFSDAQGNVANTNPVELDGQGRADIFLDNDAAYDVVFTDEDDVEIWSLTAVIASAPAV